MDLIRKVSHEKKSPSSNDFLMSLVPYWPLFVGLIGVFVLAGWLYLQVASPQYETHARILIKDEKKGSEEAKALEQFDLLSPKKSVDNELEVIQSKTLITQVVYHYNLYAPIFKKGFFKDQPAYVTSPVLLMADSANGFRPVKKVQFTYANNKVSFNGTSYPMDQWVSTPYGRLRFYKNPHIDADATGGSFYFSLMRPKDAVNNIANKLKVDAASKLSTIIDLDITDEVPRRGEDILNGLIFAYNGSLVDQNNKLAENTLKFINERLQTVQAELISIEKKQQNFRASKGAIDIGTQGKLFLENVSMNDQKVGEIGMQLSVLKQIENYVRSSDINKSIVPSTVGITDPGLTAMVKNIYDLQLDMESLKKTAGENNPLVLADKDKIDKIRPQILENIENQKQSLVASRSNLSATSGGYNSTLQEMPETERTLVDINREQTIKNGIYTFLLQKKEETALSFVSNMPGSQLVDPAQSSDNPVSPKTKIIYLICIFGALITGVAIVLSKESLGGKIMFQKDIEELTNLPIIAEITNDKTKRPIVIGNRQRTLVAEQFRRLRTTLNHLEMGPQKKRVMVTSGISGEGKSFVSVNLAMSLALTGKKVVLVDFDLNKPTLSKKLDMKEAKGVTEYLQHRVTSEEIIQSTKLDENLFFVSSGFLPDNPSELMMNGMAEDLLNELDNRFDHVVVDIAPVGPVSDAYIISPFCDVTLYVVRHGFTPKSFIERMDENIKLNKLNNVAIVFNGVEQRGFGKSYGYGYGAGYVSDNGDYHKRLSAG